MGIDKVLTLVVVGSPDFSSSLQIIQPSALTPVQTDVLDIKLLHVILKTVLSY